MEGSAGGDAARRRAEAGTSAGPCGGFGFVLGVERRRANLEDARNFGAFASRGVEGFRSDPSGNGHGYQTLPSKASVSPTEYDVSHDNDV